MSTLLLPLTPAGEGTLHVEAFASYFARLAYTHNCSLAQLARFLSSHHSSKTGQPFTLCESMLYSHTGAGLFGYRERAESYVELVENAVGSSTLRRCTLVPLRPALAAQCIDSVRSDRAWCEQCFRDDLRTGVGPYDRLLWTLKAIERCPDHRVALRNKCPACDTTQHFYHRTGEPGICWKCGHTLVGAAAALRAQLIPCLGESDLCAVVQAIASGNITDVDPDAFETFQNTLRSVLSPLATVVFGIAEISGSARLKGIPVKPSLKSMLRKCHAAGVSLLHVLQDPTSAALAAGQLIFDRNMISATARIRHPKEIIGEVEAALLGHLRLPRTQQIPRLSEVAESCGVSEGFVRHHCATIVKLYQSHRISANIYQTNEAMSRCRELLANDDYLEKTRHLHRNIKRRAIQLSVDAKCGVRLARLVLKWTLGK